MITFSRCATWALAVVAALPAGPASAQVGSAPDFAELAPLLAQRCVMCHSGDSAAAGLRLDSFESLRRGSARGPVIKAGDPAGSELIRRLKGTSQPRMPMTGPPYLPDEQVALFERWVTAGAPEGAARAAKADASLAPAPPAAGEPVGYHHVAPIFARRCAKCHTDNGAMGPAPEGYRLTSHAATLAATDRARVVPGQPAASELVRRIRGQARPRMPFDGPPYLSEDEIRLIEAWIAQGARDAEGRPAASVSGARVRLHGTLDPGGRLDGLELHVNAGARTDKQPRPGDYVEVRGSVGRGGEVSVERMRRR